MEAGLPPVRNSSIAEWKASTGPIELNAELSCVSALRSCLKINIKEKVY
jgi:hypothetical protein